MPPKSEIDVSVPAFNITDVCTKEEALATPEQLKAQAEGPTPRPIPR